MARFEGGSTSTFCLHNFLVFFGSRFLGFSFSNTFLKYGYTHFLSIAEQKIQNMLFSLIDICAFFMLNILYTFFFCAQLSKCTSFLNFSLFNK